MIDTAMTARTARPLRFGLNMLFSKSVAQYVQSAPRAADIGFDVVLVGDHLGHQSPLSTLVAIADAVPPVRVGNLVLNAPLYAPALLARELATVEIASGGRLEIGLGSGYIERDFTGYGLPFPCAGQRVDMLGEHLRTIRSLLSSPDYGPPPVQSPPPILVAGIGDKMLSLIPVKKVLTPQITGSLSAGRGHSSGLGGGGRERPSGREPPPAKLWAW
jgi:probable F420-dependent oxidoreductase